MLSETFEVIYVKWAQVYGRVFRLNAGVLAHRNLLRSVNSVKQEKTKISSLVHDYF